MTEQLHPCPFCGSEPRAVDGDKFSTASWVCCDECCIEMEASTIDKAVAAWNRRAAATPRPAQDCVCDRVLQECHKLDAEGKEPPAQPCKCKAEKDSELHECYVCGLKSIPIAHDLWECRQCGASYVLAEEKEAQPCQPKSIMAMDEDRPWDAMGCPRCPELEQRLNSTVRNADALNDVCKIREQQLAAKDAALADSEQRNGVRSVIIRELGDTIAVQKNKLAEKDAELAEAREALECALIGMCAVAVPNPHEREVLQDAADVVRKAIKKHGGE